MFPRVRVLLLLAMSAIAPRAQAPSILSLAQSVQFSQADIWGGISYDGENISVTTTLIQNRPHLIHFHQGRDRLGA